jgi:streptomycin 6-kinase
VRQDLLVNQDLHYENVLAGEREDWLVIDPKPLRGDPEFAIAPLLWNRFESGPGRFEQVVREAGLDRGLALDWTLFRVLEYWLWALDLGFTEDSGRCRALAEELLQGWSMGAEYGG